MHARTAVKTLLAGLLAVLALTSSSPRTGATTEPAAPTPALRLSDKPPPGCCCLSKPGAPSSGDCSYGLQEDKCKVAGRLFPDRVTIWTPGKCPQP